VNPTKTLIHLVPAFLHGGKAAVREVKHSTPSRFKVKNEWNYTSVPPICLQTRTMENLPFTSYVRQDIILMALDTMSCFSVSPIDNITVATGQDVRGRSD
jgi:hypothetical protein